MLAIIDHRSARLGEIKGDLVKCPFPVHSEQWRKAPFSQRIKLVQDPRIQGGQTSPTSPEKVVGTRWCPDRTLINIDWPGLIENPQRSGRLIVLQIYLGPQNLPVLTCESSVLQ